MQTSHQQIEVRAYHFWQERGQPWGDPDTDWFKAEKENIGEENPLSKVAREVGGALGTVVAALKDTIRQQ